MINVLSYIGMNMRSELCLWTLLGIIRTIFDATLFRVNANLKQVWQMSMPDELSMSVQRVLRTMISGVMLVQCFTVYVYLASYIVLLYPVFLEERPTLVLPWLLLAAVRKLLCELTSLALGLGTCVLLGPARPPCIKFVIIKVISIMPSFYMWMLLLSYYHVLKVAAVFKTFPATLPSEDQDYGLELAIRRRRTKSLLGEEQLRSKIVAGLYGERISDNTVLIKASAGISSRMIHSTDTSAVDLGDVIGSLRQNHQSFTFKANCVSETDSCEDWFGSELVMPRSCDRILEQFALMLLRIKMYMDKEGVNTASSQVLNNKPSHHTLANYDNINCASIATDDTETSLLVGSSRISNTNSYLQEYPQIFMKKLDVLKNENKIATSTIQTRQEREDIGNVTKTRTRAVTMSSKEKVLVEIEKIVSQRKFIADNSTHHERKVASTTTSTEILNSLKEIKMRNVESSIKPSTTEAITSANVNFDHLLNSSSNKENINKNQNRIERNVKFEHKKEKPSNSSKGRLVENTSCSTDEASDDDINEICGT